MSRIATGDKVVVKAGTNIYTMLVIVATLVQLIGFIAIFMRHQTVFGTGLF